MTQIAEILTADHAPIPAAYETKHHPENDSHNRTGKPRGKGRKQQIDIYFNLIGQFSPDELCSQ
ncbi:MAG: hypothetical protein SOW48_00315 [Peptoniphilaceae bacterium]|nr:hypothetical protein [Peptoniphilaceae bacterium]MDY3075095.1 hypothetical protein [Peptoniphilaceae bacterium]